MKKNGIDEKNGEQISQLCILLELLLPEQKQFNSVTREVSSSVLAIPKIAFISSCVQKCAGFPDKQAPINSKKSFHESAQECNAVPVSAFTGELHRQIDEYFDKNA